MNVRHKTIRFTLYKNFYFDGKHNSLRMGSSGGSRAIRGTQSLEKSYDMTWIVWLLCDLALGSQPILLNATLRLSLVTDSHQWSAFGLQWWPELN